MYLEVALKFNYFNTRCVWQFVAKMSSLVSSLPCVLPSPNESRPGLPLLNLKNPGL